MNGYKEEERQSFDDLVATQSAGVSTIKTDFDKHQITAYHGDEANDKYLRDSSHNIVLKREISNPNATFPDDDEPQLAYESMPPPPAKPLAPIESASGENGSELDEGEGFPEGGLRAWLVSFGAWCAMTMTFGMVNTAGFLQAWITEHQLKGISQSKISWMFSIYASLLFFGGIQVGPIFDKYGLKFVLIPGCIGSVASVFILSVCKEYYQFMLGYGVLGGIAASLVFTPSIASVGHWFYYRRGLATGISATGGAVGGLVFPLAMNKMVGEIGFGWTVRVIGFVVLALAIGSILTLKTRIKAKEGSNATMDLTRFKDLRFLFTTLGIFMIEWGIFVPVNYITTYALANGMDASLAYKLTAFLSVGSIPGRFLPGWIADKWGRFNTMIVTALLCSIVCFCLWIPAGSNQGAIIAFSVLFGVLSGTGICLTPVCISQICRTEDYGTAYGTCYSFVSFGVLTGLPIAGAILESMNGDYKGLIAFSGATYFVGSVFFLIARIIGGGAKLRKIY
ncbi:probable transporter Mch4p [Trichomonascus vanleenenianus]|uniref:MCT family MFS transporter n=1 Tax=Trichomonascus vanleenenianus TaxID=2268995 RepID=UPI003EC9A35F